MEITFGPFYTCFLATIFLAVYLYIIIHHSAIFQEWLIRCSIIGILMIIFRMIVPINFPFTYTIYSYKFLPILTEFTTYYIPRTSLQVMDVMFGVWFLTAIILLFRLFLRYRRMNQYLTMFYVKREGEYEDFYNLLDKYSKKEIRIAIVPEMISPAITGFSKPILILSDSAHFSARELEYVFKHEIEHYNKKHLWFGLITEIFCRINWWNPFAWYVKNEFSLFLELSNDYLLIQSDAEFDVVAYADLIVKTAKKIHTSKELTLISSLDFVVEKKSILKTRVEFLLEKSDSGYVKKWQKLFCIGFVSISVLLTIFVVPEARFPDNPKKQEGAVEITEENAYILKTENAYSIFVYGEYFGTIDYIPEDLKNIPIYNEGDIIDNK